jgi:small GTP-binding protein
MSLLSTHSIEEIDAKVVVIGSVAIGKTSLAIRYCQGEFEPLGARSTIGASLLTKRVVMGKSRLNLQIWDTSGQERYKSMAPMYFRGASAALLCIECTGPSSLLELKRWVEELSAACATTPLLYLVVTMADKLDLEGREQALAPARAYARTISAELFVTSAKTGEGVDDLFSALARAILHRHELVKSGRDRHQNTAQRNQHIEIQQPEPRNKKGCCTE